MINFFEELEKYLSIPVDETINGFHVILLKSGAYIEGHLGILTLGEDEISFKTKKEVISFWGNSLTIAKLDRDSAVVKGNIFKVERGAIGG